MDKKILYKNIKYWYSLLQICINKEFSLGIQFSIREYLNENIRLYKFNNGKRNIDKFMKYYVFRKFMNKAKRSKTLTIISYWRCN